MKPFYTLIGLVLLAALVAPFFITLQGQPLMTVDEVLDDATPDALKSTTEVYRWQDEHGVWQFSEEPPPQASAHAAETVQIEDKITSLGKQWHGGIRPRTPSTPTQPIPGIGGLLQGKELMDAAQSQVGNANQRTEQLNAVLKDVKGRQ